MSVLFALIFSAHAHQSALLILAHPDDESTFGGVLGRLAEAHVPVYAVYLTRGEGSPVNHVDPEGHDPKLSVGVLRPRELANAAKYFGFKAYKILNQPDAGYTTDPATFLGQNLWHFDEIEEAITAMAREAKPTVVLTMLPRHERVHAHHQLAARTAVKLFATGALGTKVEGIYGATESDWEEPGTFALEDQLGLHFPRTATSRVTKKTWYEYEVGGAKFHRTQDTPFRSTRADEVLVPLYERHDVTSILRELANPDRAQALHHGDGH